MKIDKTSLARNIWLLTFENQRDITSTFLRFQEHYESPEFKGKIFTLEEFKTWYVANSPKGQKTGKFTYYEDWNGFNIPSVTLNPFYEGKFDPLTAKEKKILELFHEEPHPYYIIGIHKGNKLVKGFLKHETAHGLYATLIEYKTKIDEILRRFDSKLEPIKVELLSRGGYHPEVLGDECHAQAVFKSRKIKTILPTEFKKEVRKIFEEYSG